MKKEQKLWLTLVEVQQVWFASKEHSSFMSGGDGKEMGGDKAGKSHHESKLKTPELSS